MKRIAQFVPLVLISGLVVVGAQTPSVKVLERLDPALDALVAPDAKLELLGEHFGFVEGPVWVQEGSDGYLLFSDIPANLIYKRTSSGQLSIFLENSGYTGKDILNAGAQSTSGRLHIVFVGSNGLSLDREGRLIVAAQADRSVVRLEKDGRRTILGDRYEGKRFNGPNDLTVKSNGAVYFTDTSAGLRNREANPTRELLFYGFYLIKNGQTVLLDKDLAPGNPNGFPNGITLSPDEKYLYVGAGGKILRYDVLPDDTVANRRVLIDVSTDGMKVDSLGNIYSTTEGAVWISSPEGKHLGTIVLPPVLGGTSTNVGFGDADSKGLYITARSRLYKIRLKVPGVRPGPQS